MSTIMRKTRYTMVAALVVGLASPVMLPTAEAQADEVVRTNGDVNLRARPGERAPTLVRLDEGTKVRVLDSQGRWLKVSYKGKVGWVTRTQVDDDGETVSARASADKKRTAPAKARKKGFNSLDDEAVGGDAVDEEDEDWAEDEDSDDPLADEEEEVQKPKKKVAKARPAPKKKAKAKKAKKAPKIEEGSEVVVARSTTVRQKPSKKGEELWDVDKGSEMVVVAVSDDGSWTKVEDSDGEKGWVASKDLAARGGSMDDEDSGDAIDEESGDDEGGSRSVRRRVKKGQNAVRVNADLGLLSKQQVYASNGMGLVSNYQLANTAPAVILGGSLMRNMGSYWAGLEVGGMMTVGGDGITIAGAMPEVLTWAALEINARGVLSYSLDKKKGYAISGRAGYHTASVTVAPPVTAKLPSEKVAGLPAGPGFDAPMLTDSIGVRLSVDYMVSGTLEQTEGLKDGEQSKTSIFLVGASGNYKLSAKMDIHAHYQMNFEGFGFGGTNQREATATGAVRKDVQHVVGAGIGYQF